MISYIKISKDSKDSKLQKKKNNFSQCEKTKSDRTVLSDTKSYQKMKHEL